MLWRTARPGLKGGSSGARLLIPLLSEAGQKQLFTGWEEVNHLPYADAAAMVKHPVSCLDCHDPKTMVLRITRPAFIEGIANLAKSDEPVPHLPSIERWRKSSRKADYNPNELASRQELRSMTCAQCHVEVLLQGRAEAADIPVAQGPQGRGRWRRTTTRWVSATGRTKTRGPGH